MNMISFDNTQAVADLLAIPLTDVSISAKFTNPCKSLSDVLSLIASLSKNGLSHSEIIIQLQTGTSYCLNQHGKYRGKYSLRSSEPKTLVCHDYKGGYLIDKTVEDSPNNGEYIFTEWWSIDSFVYFSHYFVTIPPVSWINAGHRHAVPVLGTLITEGKEGKEIWDQLLRDAHIWHWFAEALCAISRAYKFDGYLINIENNLAREQCQLLIQFLQLLRKLLPESSHLIWYDSLTIEGHLKWQNMLNENNRAFFDVCDGIYLNYNYTDVELMTSAMNAAGRKHDVYVGIDVFGRGSPGRGFVSSVGMEMARRYDLSVAIFAPGWTYESAPGYYAINDRIFWSSLRRYLFLHGLKDRFVSTKFCEGRSTDWWNLFRQDLQTISLSVLNADLEKTGLFKLNYELDTVRASDKMRSMELFYQSLPDQIITFNQDGFHPRGRTMLIKIQSLKVTLEIPLFLLEKTCDRIRLNIVYRRGTLSHYPKFYFMVEDSKHRLIRRTIDIDDNRDGHFTIYHFEEENLRYSDIAVRDGEVEHLASLRDEYWNKCSYLCELNGTVLEFGLLLEGTTNFSIGYLGLTDA